MHWEIFEGAKTQSPAHSEPALMAAPVSRSVHRMGYVLRLSFHPPLTNILLQSVNLFWLLILDHFFLLLKFSQP